MPAVERLLDLRYLLLLLLGAFLLLGSTARATPDNDWHFFTFGGDLLFGEHRDLVRSTYSVEGSQPGGLHVYASYPFLQIGPPALLLGRLLQIGPDEGLLLAGAVVQALGLLFVLLLERAFRTTPSPGRLRSFAAAVAVTAAWSMLVHYRHLDDAMSLTAVAAGVLALQRGRTATAGALLGLAAGCKPWAVPVVALAFAAPTAARRIGAVVAALASAGACWAPFVLYDRGTLRLGDVGVNVTPGSALSALGVHTVSNGSWLRLGQFGIGLALAALLTARGQWHMAPLAAFSSRLALEPASYLYYASPVVAMAVLADAAAAGRRWPWWTIIAVAGWLAAVSASGRTAGFVRLTTYAGLALAAVAVGLRRRASSPAATVT